MYSYTSILRGALPEGALPDAGEQGGYHLDPAVFVVDWAATRRLSDEPADRPGWADRARAALELVRGQPLAGGSWEGIEPMVRLMRGRVEHLARRLVAHLLSEQDAPGADWAATGPSSPWRGRSGCGRTDQAAAAGSGRGVAGVWAEAPGRPAGPTPPCSLPDTSSCSDSWANSRAGPSDLRHQDRRPSAIGSSTSS